MSGFDDRKKGEEKKFANDAEFWFKTRARRDRLVGEWVAKEFLSLSDDEAAVFAKDVVATNLEEKGDSNVIQYILNQVDQKGGDLSEHRLQNKLSEFMAMAEEQIKAES